MNLLLYTESKIALARLADGHRDETELNTVSFDPAQTLPDSLFEELGYFGALDEDNEAGEGSFDGLLNWFAETALIF